MFGLRSYNIRILLGLNFMVMGTSRKFDNLDWDLVK